VNWPSRFGGWATGRQPVTVRELTVRKHKLWPGKGQAKVKKTELNGRSPISGPRFALDCTAIYEEEEDDDDDDDGGKE